MSKNRLGTKALFVNNTVSQNSSVFNSSNVLINPVLKRIMIELIYYSNLYSIGDLESLTNEFTLDLYTRYSKCNTEKDMECFKGKKGGVTKADDPAKRFSNIALDLALFLPPKASEVFVIPGLFK